MCLWQYPRSEENDNLTESESFKSKIRTTGNSLENANTKNLEIAVPLKYLSIFWRTLEMLLIDCKINLILTWSENFVISLATGKIKFEISDTKLYVPFVTFSTQDNANPLKKLKWGFKRTINWLNN